MRRVLCDLVCAAISLGDIMPISMIFLLGLYTAVGAVLSYAFFGVIVPTQNKYYFKINLLEPKVNTQKSFEEIINPKVTQNIKNKVAEAKRNLNKFERGQV